MLKEIKMMGDSETGSGDPGIAVADETKIEKPKMYKVLMHNDDYSTMEFVIHVLMKFLIKIMMMLTLLCSKFIMMAQVFVVFLPMKSQSLSRLK